MDKFLATSTALGMLVVSIVCVVTEDWSWESATLVIFGVVISLSVLCLHLVDEHR